MTDLDKDFQIVDDDEEDFPKRTFIRVSYYILKSCGKIQLICYLKNKYV